MPINMKPEATPKPPPPRRNTVKPRTPAVQPSVSRVHAREDGVKGIGQMIALGLTLRGQKADALAIAQHNEPIAHEIALIADDNDKIGDIIDQLAKAGPYGGLVMAVLPLAMQIAVNHDRLSADDVVVEGVVSKDDLLKQAAPKNAATLAEIQ
jgi:hypothetical protein